MFIISGNPIINKFEKNNNSYISINHNLFYANNNNSLIHNTFPELLPCANDININV